MLTIEQTRRVRELNYSRVSPAQEAISALICAVPTGEDRNKLTEINIHLMRAQQLMRELCL